MRYLLSRWHVAPSRKFQAIAIVSILVLLGLALKPVAQTNANILDTPANEPAKPQAKTTARILQRQEQTRQIRVENFDLTQFPIASRNEYHWRHLLWTTALVEPQEPFVAAALNQILSLTTRKDLSPVETRTVDMAMKVSTQLYLSDPEFYGLVGQRFLETIEQSPDPEWVAVALSGLKKGKMSATELQRLSVLVKARFPNWATNVFLQTTLQEIADGSTPPSVPPLKELLNWAIAPQQLHLYVLCRPDRRVVCRAVLKDRQGEFVRQEKRLWSVPLLLESIHSLGWNFTRGQTPQGIFRIEGTVPQEDDEFFRAYGQFPLVKLFVPFEQGAKQFLPGQAGAFSGSLASYTAMLPPSWRTYRPMQQSYWAGKAGRGLFRIHGSGESTDFFRGKDKNFSQSYDWNPTIGCLSAKELYSDQGKLLQADMPQILQTLEMTGGKNFAGYVVVVDVPSNEKDPVSLDTIQGAIVSHSASTSSKSAKQIARSKPLAGESKSAALLNKSVNSIRTSRQYMNKLVLSLDRLGKSAPVDNEKAPTKLSQDPQTNPETSKPFPIAY